VNATTITDHEAFAILTIHAMNQLFVVDECCPECCYPCDVLQQLAARPDGPASLAEIISHAPESAAGMWHNRDVRAWLASKWIRTECHQDQL
jgi:hypothetical protein